MYVSQISMYHVIIEFLVRSKIALIVSLLQHYARAFVAFDGCTVVPLNNNHI